MSENIKKLTYSALFLALSLTLPLLTGQIPEIGNALCPMHLPVLLCGFICGAPWGLAVGAVAPILRSLIFSAPALFPRALYMSFELAAYGLLSGVFYRLFPRRLPFTYLSLLLAMLGGRIVWGIARFIFYGFGVTEFSFSAFLVGGFLEAIPGIILQIVLIPLIIQALRRTGHMPD